MAQRARRWNEAWTHWYRRALPAYWILLFCLTHFPELEVGGPPSSDKVAHLAAFGLLAFLFWRFAETLWQPLTGRFVWIAAAGLLMYAAFDEYTQQFVGRGVEGVDLAANATGIALALAFLEWRRRRRAAAD